jgi:hypothetical protein
MAYIGNSPDNIQRGRRFIYEFTASAGQTVFSGTDDNNQTLDLLEANEQSVFLNGVRLIPTDDYTVSGDVLTLTSAASLNDFLVVETQAEIVNISTYTRSESDARYVNYNGDIISGDLQVVGNVSVSSGDISLGDNDKAIFGAGSDLQIYHNGSNSFIEDRGTGNLYIDGSSSVVIRGDTANTISAVFNDNGAVNIRYGGDIKLATTSTGVDITGTITADAYALDIIALPSAGTATIFNRNTDNNLYIQTDSGNTVYLLDGSQNTMYAVSPTSHIFQISNAEKMRIDNSGNVGIGLNSPSKKLDVDTTMRVTNAAGTSAAEFDISSGSTWRFRAQPTSGPNAYGLDVIKGSAGTDIKLSIDSSGNVGIGESSPQGRLHLKKTDTGNSPQNPAGNQLVIENGDSSGSADIQFLSASNGYNHIFFGDAADANVGVLLYDHTNNSMQFQVNASERMRITTDKVQFNVDAKVDADNSHDLGAGGARWKDLYLSGGVYVGGTGSANYLDDYEEGTWTPVYQGNTSAGTATYTRQNGTYVKVGSLVYVACTLGFTGHTATGSVIIAGLPFTALTSTGNYAGISVSFNSGHAATANYQIGGFVQVGSSTIRLYEFNGGSQQVLAVDANVSEFDFSLVYRAV